MTEAPGRRPAHDRLFHLPDPARVDSGQRLVEDEDLGVVEEAAGDDELLLHAPGELRGKRALLARKLQLVEEGAGAGRLPPTPYRRPVNAR